MKFFVLSALLAASVASTLGYYAPALQVYPNGAVAPVETPEVQAAKAKHFAAHAERALGHAVHAPAWPAVPAWPHAAPVIAYHHAPAAWPAYHPVAPGVPHDTPEVAAAKAAHLAAVAEAKARIHHHYKRSIWNPYSPNAVHAWPAAPAHFAPAPPPHNGVPQDTIEVQLAKQAHFAAVAKAQAGAGHIAHHYAPAPAHGPVHVPVIHNGVPVDTPEVQHAKAAHFAAVQKAQAAAYSHPAPAPAHHHAYAPAPVIHNGVPVDTPEVQHAKAAHFAAVQKAQAAAYSHPAPAPAAPHWEASHYDDGSYRPEHHYAAY